MIDAGLVPGPRILTAAHSLGIPGGHCDLNGYRPDVLAEVDFVMKGRVVYKREGRALAEPAAP